MYLPPKKKTILASHPTLPYIQEINGCLPLVMITISTLFLTPIQNHNTSIQAVLFKKKETNEVPLFKA
jgi:hypothetical protein